VNSSVIVTQKFDDRDGLVSCGEGYNCHLSSCEELSEGEGSCNEDQDIDEGRPT